MTSIRSCAAKRTAAAAAIRRIEIVNPVLADAVLSQHQRSSRINAARTGCPALAAFGYAM
jgi:hypothetical protein